MTTRTKELLPAIKDFLIQEIYPLENLLTTKPFRALEPILEAKREMVKKNGWWVPQMPVKLGGLGFSLVELAQLSELLGTTPLGHYVFNCQAPDSGNMELLHSHASVAQQIPGQIFGRVVGNGEPEGLILLLLLEQRINHPREPAGLELDRETGLPLAPIGGEPGIRARER